MDLSLIVLTLVIVTALTFDLTSGFHDTGNAMATSIATGAFKPKAAGHRDGLVHQRVRDALQPRGHHREPGQRGDHGAEPLLRRAFVAAGLAPPTASLLPG